MSVIIKIFSCIYSILEKKLKFCLKRENVRPYKQLIHIPNEYIKNTEQEFFKIMYFTESRTHIFAHSESQFYCFQMPLTC